MRAGQMLAPYYPYAAKLPKNETLAVSRYQARSFARWKFQLVKKPPGEADNTAVSFAGRIRLNLS